MNNTFDFNRFSLLLKREIWSGNKKLPMIAGAVFGFAFAYALFMIYTDYGYEHLNFNLFIILIFGGGYILTSVMFYEFNDKVGTHHYLSLPASALEKFMSKWLISAVIFPIVATLMFWFYVIICNEIYFNHSGVTEFDSWEITNWWTIFFIRLYFVSQALYLIGAIAFQKYTFFKTSAVGWLVNIVFALLVALAIRLMFAECFEGIYSVRDDMVMDMSRTMQVTIDEKLLPTLEYMGWLLVAPVLWLVGFYKLKEKEA